MRAARLNAPRGARARRAFLPPLIFMTDAARFPDPAPAIAALPRGAAVIVRHYGDPNRAGLARRLKPLCRARGVMLLIAGDPALAARIGADGVHWPDGLARPHARRKGWLVTAAAHSFPALLKAYRAGADAALVSPVFATASGSDKKPLGLMRFAALATRAPLPVYALGGIDARAAARLNGLRLAGLAAISALTPP